MDSDGASHDEQAKPHTSNRNVENEERKTSYRLKADK
jgi:hypothetical protein